MPMLRIYLDQNHWVALTKARTGRADGAGANDALLLLREAVSQGLVSLPLSMRHMIETHHRANFDSRLALAGTMRGLSRWHAIAPGSSLVDAEIDRALAARFGRPAFPRRRQVFGVGANHACGRDVVNYEPDDPDLTPEQRLIAKRLGTSILEAAALAGPPPGFTAPDYLPRVERQVAKRFAAEQEEMRDIRTPNGYSHGERGRQAASIDTFGEFERAFTEALTLAGLHWGHIYALDEPAAEQLIADIPTVLAHRELRRLRHEGSQKSWQASDLNDLAALAPAIVYCDIVVTEKLWTHLADRASLGARFHTTILRSLDDLIPAIVGATATAA